MKSLAAFAQLARKAGAVPHVPQQGNGLGNRVDQLETLTRQGFQKSVPHVLHVPHANSNDWNEEDWQAAFDERAAILESNEGLSRAEAEVLARQQVFGARGAVKSQGPPRPRPVPTVKRAKFLPPFKTDFSHDPEKP